jgi:hypothetical protein
MTKRTRLFVFVATGILVAGLGTGLLASYMGGIQNLVLIGGNGPADLAYVPADAKAVAYANVRDVMDSEFRQKLLPFGGTEQGADQFRDQTGIDIRTQVDQVVAAINGDGADQRPLVLVRGTFDVALLESLIRQKGAVVEEYQGRRLLTHADGDMALAFVDTGLVAVGSAASVRRAIDTKASGQNITANADVMRLVKEIESGNAWAVARFDALAGAPPIPAELASQLPPITWLAASGHVNGGLRAALRAETRDEASASNLREVIQGFLALARLQLGQRAEFADLLNSFELGGQGNTVSLAFALPPELLDVLSAIHAQRAPRPAPGTQELPPTLHSLPAEPGPAL